MSNQTRWGLFKGFNPHPKEALWEPPHCNRCDGDGYLKESLLPWVDWWSIGAIGYCARCTHFYHVSSAWEQIPGTHLKEERDRLVGHEVTEIELEKMLSWFSVNWRIAPFELDYANGEIHHAKTT